MCTTALACARMWSRDSSLSKSSKIAFPHVPCKLFAHFWSVSDCVGPDPSPWKQNNNNKNVDNKTTAYTLILFHRPQPFVIILTTLPNPIRSLPGLSSSIGRKIMMMHPTLHPWFIVKRYREAYYRWIVFNHQNNVIEHLICLVSRSYQIFIFNVILICHNIS